MIDLRKQPFYLSEEAIAWVNQVFDSMSIDEKIGQLFVPIGYSTEKRYLDHLLMHHIGGLFFRDGDFSEMKATFDYVQAQTKIPLLIPANLENGGNGALTNGTAYANQMAVAASNRVENAYTLGTIAAKEGKKVGVNWTFAPVVDIDLNFRNPITNVRTYGDNSEKIIAYAKEYTRAFHENGLMTSAKHFPGDGVDERDQHLLTSINTLPIDIWRTQYGTIYQELIDSGTKSIMAGHIALPDYTGDEMPASLSAKILQDLLRKELGFNGLIITDATPMVGFTSAMPRSQAVPYSIEAGCDMFLFNKDFVEDVRFMKEGLTSGILSKERLDEAVLRILATKASLNLNQGVSKEQGSLLDFTHEKEKIAQESITLVRDEPKLLPINANYYKRVLLQILGDFSSNEQLKQALTNGLESKGFIVTHYEKESHFFDLDSVDSFKEKYDLVIYAANIENASNQTTARINWHTLFGLGNNLPWFVCEIPTLLISFGNPYHYFDAPMIETQINAYCNYDHFVQATVRKLVGEESFVGINPIDPFCTNTKLKELIK